MARQGTERCCPLCFATGQSAEPPSPAVVLRTFLSAVCILAVAWAQAPGTDQKAYDALRSKDYDAAIAWFRQAIKAAPEKSGLRKDLAYTYLKTGETEAARDEFAQALRLDPADEHVALEYAFLCYETRQAAEARRTFDRLRKTAGPAARAAAEQAFRNIDAPLEQGIARWSAVVAQSPGNFSAHLELAQLAEQRDDFELAATHYLAAWKVRPAERDLLLDLGRVWKAMGKEAEAKAALLAASRASRPRVAEQARELLPARYPYIAEFRAALNVDPENMELRRELAYLLLEMKQKDEAEREFRTIAEQAPQDLSVAAQLGFLLLERQDRAGAMTWFERVLKSDNDDLIEKVRTALRMPAELRRRKARAKAAEAPASGEISPKEMGERSFKAGFMKDAVRYFEAAHEADQLDFGVMLKLGWAYNAIHQDDQAIRWFDLARRSPDPDIAREAGKAFRSLRPAVAGWRVTTWAFPFYSTRWHDLFSYAQAKADVRLGDLPVRPYLSLRFIGDTRQTTSEAVPQYLSESSFLAAFGLATHSWRGATAWGEAGNAIRYTGGNNRGRMVPDYRGGISYGAGRGRLLGAKKSGWFAETHDDGVFVSRFGNDFLVYVQNQTGYTLPRLSWMRTQFYWNGNITFDAHKQYWANFVETGPGFRVHWAGLPESVVFSVNFLRGSYLTNEGNPGKPVFWDLRVGFWYALTR